MSTILHTTSSTLPAHAPGRIAFETDTGNLIISDGVAWRAFNHDGVFSQVASFDGIGDFIDTNEKFDFIQQTCNFSITFWVKLIDHASTANNQFFIMSAPGGNNVGFMCWYDNRSSAKKLRCLLSGLSEASLDINNGITDNNWHHIAVTSAASGNLILYRDGSEIGSQLANSTNANTAYHNLVLGAALLDSNIASPMNGYLDEVAIFDYELSSNDITNLISSHNYTGATSLYKFEGNANDSMGPNDGTNNGATFEGALVAL